QWVVAIDGVLFDPNPPWLSHMIYKPLQAKFAKAWSKIPYHAKVTGLFPRMELKGRITETLYTLRIRNRRRRRDDLGPVVAFASQEVENYPGPATSERNATGTSQELDHDQQKDGVEAFT